jgi:uncharacterized protein (TIGR02284 family)
MADEKDLVKDVVQVLHDGHKGFVDMCEHLTDPVVKAYFVKEAATRGEFEHELKRAAGIHEDVGGTALGAVHRTWGDLKVKLGGGDHTLLETAEQGEDAAKKAYKDALAGQLRPAVRDILIRQQAHIVASHDQVKAFRDSKAA